MTNKKIRIPLLLVAIVLACNAPHQVFAEEPAESFLKQLRANRYFDMALAYIDRIEKGAPATDDVRSAIELERAQTHLEAASASRVPAVRDESYVLAETSLRTFIEKQKDHPRIGEARMQLGKLLLIRAVVLLGGKKVDDSVVTTARESLDASATVFDEIVNDLREKLKDMQGNKIDPKDSAKLALRERYRGEFLGAILLGGDVRERAADTLPEKSPDRIKRYDDALTKYNELSEKYGGLLPGAKAAFYIGRVQEKKGDAEAALKAYENTMKLPDADELRDTKTEAAARAIDILLSQSPPKSAEAVKLASPWMDGLRPNERNAPQWQILRTALAKAYLAEASGQKPAEARKSNSSARALLVAATKVPGDHVDEARTLLADIGIDVEEGDAADLPAPKSFSEAMTSSRELMDAANLAALPIQVLKDQVEKGDGNVAELNTQIAAAEQEVEKKLSAASDVLQQGLGLVVADDTKDAVNQGRYLLALIESKRKRHWEAAVVGEFVCRRFPTDPLALQCGLIALQSYQFMLQEADDAKRPSVMRKIQPLATFLTQKWPDDPNAGTAANLLVQISMLEKRWDDAEKYLVKIPAENASRARFHNLLGLSLWNEYQGLLAGEDAVQIKATLDRAITQLQAGMKLVQRQDVDHNTLLGSLILAKALMIKDDAKAALETLDNKTYGPLQRLKGDDKVAPPDGVMTDTYRTALTALFGQLKQGGAADKLLPKAEEIMADMRTSLQAEPDASKKLVGIYLTLAKDIREQIEQANPQEKTKLIDLFRLLLTNLGDQAKDNETVHWVAQTFIQLGESAMGTANPPATGQAKDLLEGAAKQLKALVEKQKDDVETVRTIRFELATTSRLLGEYKDAINELEAILKDKNSMLDAQVEAAMSYQQWALSKGFNPKYIKNALNSAMSGARPDATGKNTIWGWARLSKLTQGKKAYEATFFDSRYRIAECLYETGQRAPGEDKAKYAEKAEGVILNTLELYSKLGGAEDIARNDRLIRKIQAAQNKQVNGLP